jgi:hypothetical protein
MSTQKEPTMSKMSELAMDIEYLLKEGKSFVEIAGELDIPVHFVVEAQAGLDDTDSKECSPFATINS